MRRSKKSLGRAILVSVLSASMVMTAPVYAADYLGVNEKVTGDVTNGIYAVGGSKVTISGTVSGKEENGEDIYISDNSNITIDGDANCSQVDVENDSTLKVGGNVNSADISNSDSNLTVDKNVKTGDLNNYGGTVTIGGDVETTGTLGNSDGTLSVGGDVKSDRVTVWGSLNVAGNISSSPDSDDRNSLIIASKGANVSVGKDVTLTGTEAAIAVSGRRNGDSSNKTTNVTVGGDVNVDTVDKTGGNRYGAGLSVDGDDGSKINVRIDGKITVKSQDGAEGISTYVSNDDGAKDNKTGATIKVEAGGVEISAPKKDATHNSAAGIGITNDDNTSTTIVIKGDLKSTQDGINIFNSGSGATTDIIVDGTIESNNNESGIVIFNKGENNQTNITAWKINNNTEKDDPVLVNRLEGDSKKGISDDVATKKQNENINYIIRREGTITLDGTRTITSFNGDTYETAHENEKLTIHVKVDDDKKYRVDRVEGGTATATKNADGSWTLTVPKNGGVDIRAVLVAIEQKESSSSSSSSGSSSSGGGSSSSHPGSSNVASGMTTTTTDGATVQTNVAKNNNSTTTAAAVRIGTSTANVTSSVSEQNGTKVTFQNATGNLAGTSFKTVGQISADGTTLVKEDGTTAKMATGMLLVIENADGTSIGCFVDANGKIIATGAYEVYYMLGTDGKLHAHFVNPQGYFMTGIQVINGQTVTFNAVGEMGSVL